MPRGLMQAAPGPLKAEGQHLESAKRQVLHILRVPGWHRQRVCLSLSFTPRKGLVWSCIPEVNRTRQGRERRRGQCGP